ncbi:MAG: hypothetical protein HY560_01350 [Gemmatimonadetes bacterium]|nr:hypothetical protein [Gemmatimonadota bacterium]
MERSLQRATYFLLLLTAVIAAGCASEPPMREVVLGAHDYAFAAPERVPGGLVRVHLVNEGKEPHHAQFVRLNDGVSREQFHAALETTLEAVVKEGEMAFMRLFALATVAGGPAPVAPGKNLDMVADLAPGTYALICFIPGPDGVPHVVKGMVKYLTVDAPVAPQPKPPVAAGTVDLADFAFNALPAIKAGPTVLEVKNSGKEPHEMSVVRLQGITADQLMRILATPPKPGSAPPPGPPPFEFVGGVQALMPGQRNWVTLELAAGDYVLLCLIPSPANQGKPHVALGMFKTFTVGS